MNCPVCHSVKSKQCLTLENSPVYQHPVPDPSIIPPPYSVKLVYLKCSDCFHVYQRDNYQDILEDIYSHHYYTPPASNIGTTLRDDFLLFLQQLPLSTKHISSILEVGSSSGEMLVTLKAELSVKDADGFEPNIESAQVATEKGITVFSQFFSVDSVKALNKNYDLIYSRHVIEHIFDFENFFEAINMVSHCETRLLIEAPSLDWGIDNNSAIAFHFEHIHVFSEYSLVTLANQFGWYKEASTITDSGNLITSFLKQKSISNLPKLPNDMLGMQQRNNSVWKHINKISQSRKVILWGAGTCGIALISSANVKPDYLIDGNPDKAGKYYCGFEKPVLFAPLTIKELIEKGDDIGMLVIISSSFYPEIKESLLALGWRGDIYIPDIF